MDKAIGMVEYKTVTKGIQATDLILKTAPVELIEAKTVCPGKYIVLLTGELSAIKTAMEKTCHTFGEDLVDQFILGNPHPSIFSAMYGTATINNPKALGIIETFSVASLITAADTAAKTAIVDLIELRLAKGMCGKSYCMLTGDVAAVEEAIQKAKVSTQSLGMLLDAAVITNPDRQMWAHIL